MIKLYKTPAGPILEFEEQFYASTASWDDILLQDPLYEYLKRMIEASTPMDPVQALELLDANHLPPIGSQELWASGVTYLRSRDARMEESKVAGGGDFYSRVYDADRPEIFFKSIARRVVGNHSAVRIRKDSTWNVPEPELTLFISPKGNIQGYTIGNDMSSRSIEGENPLYLPQAKSYEKAAALGPCLLVTEKPISKETEVSIYIVRAGKTMFEGTIQLTQMKRSLEDLASWLYRECDFPEGVFLMTGTGIVPPDDFTLQVGDKVQIAIQGIGVLENVVEMKS